MTARLLEVAKRYRPAGVTVKWRQDNYLTPAHARQFADGAREMYVPSPVTREALFVYLHECAHLILGHCKPTYQEPIWKQEYEAEQWTIATMRREGIAVPRAMIQEAKKYVGKCLVEDRKNKRQGPPAKILAWIKSRDKKKPKPIKNLMRPTNG